MQQLLAMYPQAAFSSPDGVEGIYIMLLGDFGKGAQGRTSGFLNQFCKILNL